MHIFSATVSIEILDCLSCAFLALAASLRGRALGANLAGTLVLGCICGLSAGMVREFILHGQQGTHLVLAQLPQDALIGSIAGIILFISARNLASKAFFFMDTLSMSLAASLTACLTAPELGAIGALALGVCLGILPGLIRDTALGDTALFLDQAWYATVVILSVLCSIAIILLPAFWTLPGFFVERLGEWAIVISVVLALLLRYWRGDKNLS